MKNNLVLIGMPASGKSTLGIVLAKAIGYDFIDSDLLIQKTTGKLLKEIIQEKGVGGFIEVENQVNASIQAEHAVIATGGSAIYGAEAMRHLKEIGRVVYLKVDFDTISSRLSDVLARGVALREGQTLHDLYEERIPLYEKYADLTIDEKDLGIEGVLKEICRSL